MSKRIEVIKNNKVVASSKSLEVILRYQRQKSPIIKVTQKKDMLYITYQDGAKINTKFATPTVLTNWIAKKRKRGVFPSKIGSIFKDKKSYKKSGLSFSPEDEARFRAEIFDLDIYNAWLFQTLTEANSQDLWFGFDEQTKELKFIRQSYQLPIADTMYYLYLLEDFEKRWGKTEFSQRIRLQLPPLLRVLENPFPSNIRMTDTDKDFLKNALAPVKQFIQSSTI